MLHTHVPSFVEINPPVLEKKIFEGFYHIWAWRPSWSCDLDFAIKLEMPLPKEAPHKISTRSTKRFQRRSLKLWTTDGRTDDGRTDAGSWPSYKLTLRAFGSGELKMQISCACNCTADQRLCFSYMDCPTIQSIFFLNFKFQISSCFRISPRLYRFVCVRPGWKS